MKFIVFEDESYSLVESAKGILHDIRIATTQVDDKLYTKKQLEEFRDILIRRQRGYRG
jgi:hypothetical protein